MNTEQLNIEGKRSGEGFVAHKVALVSALSRALSERVVLIDFTIGRKGFLTYLKSLGGRHESCNISERARELSNTEDSVERALVGERSLLLSPDRFKELIQKAVHGLLEGKLTLPVHHKATVVVVGLVQQRGGEKGAT